MTPFADLSRDAFADALQKGLGRAILRVRARPADDVDLVLEACLTDLRRDRQVETERSAYLADLAQASAGSEDIEARVLAAWEAAGPTDDTYRWAILAREFARRGSAAARAAIERAFERGGVDAWPYDGVRELVAVDGERGLLRAAAKYGARLVPTEWFRSLDEWPGPSWIRFTSGRRHALAASEDPAVRAALAAVDQAVKEWPEPFGGSPPKPPRPRRPYAELRAEALAGEGDAARAVRRSRRGAPEDERAAAFRDLVETSAPGLLRTAALFLEEDGPPGDVGPLLDRVRSSDPLVSETASRVLACRKDPRIRELAVELLDAGRVDEAVVALLERNRAPGDLTRLQTALGKAPEGDAESVHGLAWALRDLAKRVGTPWAAWLCEWGYARTPCSNCRHSAVQELATRGELHAPIVEEALYDADPQTRALARATWNGEAPDSPVAGSFVRGGAVDRALGRR